MDKCREEFETWYESYCADNGFNCNLLIMSTGSYLNTFSELCFTGWKASRESMKAIKLPDSKIYRMAQHGMTQMIDLNDTKDAITSAGYKVE